MPIHSIRISIHPSGYVFIHPFEEYKYPLIHSSGYPFIHQDIIHSSIQSTKYLFIHPPISISIHPSRISIHSSIQRVPPKYYLVKENRLKVLMRDVCSVPEHKDTQRDLCRQIQREEAIECCCFCECTTPAYRLALGSLRLKAELEDQCSGVSIVVKMSLRKFCVGFP